MARVCGCLRGLLDVARAACCLAAPAPCDAPTPTPGPPTPGPPTHHFCSPGANWEAVAAYVDVSRALKKFDPPPPVALGSLAGPPGGGDGKGGAAAEGALRVQRSRVCRPP